jgi:Fur family peroxide stress response transcriptional regulator
LALTVQRRAVLEVLERRLDHPTADDVYAAVSPKVPGLSRTTVYRVLDTLARSGVIREAGHLGSSARFDPNVDRHHHLVCLECHKVTDYEDGALDGIRIPSPARSGFEVEDFSVYFKGRCPDCRKAARRGTGGLR